MYCGKCGNEIKAGAKFCSKCGTPVPRINIDEQGTETNHNDTGFENESGTCVDSSFPSSAQDTFEINAGKISSPASNTPKSKKRWLPKVVAVVCAMVILGTGGFLAVKTGFFPLGTSSGDYDEEPVTYAELLKDTGSESEEEPNAVKASYREAITVKFSDKLQEKNGETVKKAQVTVPDMEKIFKKTTVEKEVIRYIQEGSPSYQTTFEVEVPVGDAGEPNAETLPAILKEANRYYWTPDESSIAKVGDDEKPKQLGDVDIYIGMTVDEVRNILGEEDELYNLHGSAALEYKKGIVVGVYDTDIEDLTGKEVVIYQEEWNEKGLGDGYKTRMTKDEFRQKNINQSDDTLFKEDEAWGGTYTVKTLKGYEITWFWSEDSTKDLSINVEIREVPSDDEENKDAANNEGQDFSDKTDENDHDNAGSDANSGETAVIGTWHLDRERTYEESGNVFGTSLQDGADEFKLHADRTFTWYAGYEEGEGTWTLNGNVLHLDYYSNDVYEDCDCRIENMETKSARLIMPLDQEFTVIWEKE